MRFQLGNELKNMGNLWEIDGTHVGNIREEVGKYMGDRWEHMGHIWEIYKYRTYGKLK